MKGIITAWLLTGLFWLQLFESSYRKTIRPSVPHYFAFVILVVFGWPYPMYLITLRRRR